MLRMEKRVQSQNKKTSSRHMDCTACETSMAMNTPEAERHRTWPRYHARGSRTHQTERLNARMGYTVAPEPLKTPDKIILATEKGTARMLYVKYDTVWI